MKKLFLLMAIPFFSSGKITPEIVNPDKFNEIYLTKSHQVIIWRTHQEAK